MLLRWSLRKQRLLGVGRLRTVTPREGRAVTSAMHRRLTALEGRRRPTASYVVLLPAELLGDCEAVHAAIAEHRRTGWEGPVILAPEELTLDEWAAHQGKAQV